MQLDHNSLRQGIVLRHVHCQFVAMSVSDVELYSRILTYPNSPITDDIDQLYSVQVGDTDFCLPHCF